MNYTVKIGNIGKLVNRTVQIRDFTVLAGANNTGKSFVSKLLYSFFNAQNANHVAVSLNELLSPLEGKVSEVEEWCDNADEGTPSAVLAQRLRPLFPSEAIGNLTHHRGISAVDGVSDKLDAVKMAIEEQLLVIVEDTESMVGEMNTFLLEDHSEEDESSSSIEWLSIELEKINEQLQQERLKLQNGTIRTLVVAGIEHAIRENLIGNFQVTTPTALKRNTSEPAVIDIVGVGKVTIDNGTEPSRITYEWGQHFQPSSHTLYLESPLYWKLKNALDSLSNYPGLFFMTRRARKRLAGVPKYYYDLVNALRIEYTDDMAFPELYEKLTSKNILGGKIVLDKKGEGLFFQEEVDGEERRFSLHTTATGVANLGMLALLIERKVLDEGSVLFIDEPEAHLHPRWQVEMAEALFELAQQGVGVVIATHSIDILKWLEVRVKKNPKDEQMVALNHFSLLPDTTEEKETEEEDFETKIEAIKEELAKPFSDLYLKGL